MKLKNFKHSTLDIIKKEIEENTPRYSETYNLLILIGKPNRKDKSLTKLQNIGIKTFPELLDNIESVNDLLTEQNEKLLFKV